VGNRDCRQPKIVWRVSRKGWRAGVALRPEWIIHGNYHPSSGYEMFAALCAKLGRPPKALFTAACGCLRVLRYMSQHHCKVIFTLPASTITISTTLSSLSIDTVEQNIPRACV
jgi:LacI family sucrose operon transcriptional repressor